MLFFTTSLAAKLDTLQFISENTGNFLKPEDFGKIAYLHWLLRLKTDLAL